MTSTSAGRGALGGWIPFLLLTVAFIFAVRTSFSWSEGRLLAGTHADEPFHYAAELVRLSPDHYREDPAVQESRNLGEPYASFYRAMGWLSALPGLSLRSANFLVCWLANTVHIAGLFFLLRRLGLSPAWCMVGAILGSQRFALLTGQTLVAHGLAIPREVWQSLLPWFLLWFLHSRREGWRFLLFYGVLGAVYCVTYPPWAAALGVGFGLVDGWQILRRRDWAELGWLAGGAALCLALVALPNLGHVHSLGGEQSALFDRMTPGKPVYLTKGFRRFLLFSLLGLFARWQLGRSPDAASPSLRLLGLLWGASALVAWVYQPLELVVRPLGLIYLGRLSLLNFLISMILLTLWLVRRMPEWAAAPRTAAWLGLAGLCVFPLVSAYRGRLDRSFIAFCATVRRETPAQGLFFLPPIEDVQFFRIYAERGMWIAPYDKTTLWRTKPLYALMQDRVDVLKAFYRDDTPAAAREATLARLREEHVDYVVTPAAAPWAQSLSWPVVEEHAGWQLRAARMAK